MVDFDNFSARFCFLFVYLREAQDAIKRAELLHSANQVLPAVIPACHLALKLQLIHLRTSNSPLDNVQQKKFSEVLPLD